MMTEFSYLEELFLSDITLCHLVDFIAKTLKLVKFGKVIVKL